MSSTIPWRLEEAVHAAAAMQRHWLTEARAAMEPGQPEPCGASDAYVTYALATIERERRDRAARLALKRVEGTSHA